MYLMGFIYIHLQACIIPYCIIEVLLYFDLHIAAHLLFLFAAFFPTALRFRFIFY